MPSKTWLFSITNDVYKYKPIACAYHSSYNTESTAIYLSKIHDYNVIQSFMEVNDDVADCRCL